MKLKYIPNAITLSRFIMVTSLIFLTPFSTLGMTVFIIAGLSDMVDGPLARNIKGAKSNLGAELDSMADMYMVIISVFFIVPAMSISNWLWPAILVALSFKLMSAVPGILKHRKVFFLHTLSNKFLGFILFLGAILYFIFGGVTAINIYFVCMIMAVFVITLEEMIIISLLEYPSKNIRGFWQIRMVNERYRNSNS